MRTYVVQPGDSPASIASRDDMAGCPKCAIDLIRANPHKLTVTYPNGFKTFQSLRAGEHLNLPEKWFNGELDAKPKSYFAALPYADGVTPGTGAITPAMPSGVGDPYFGLGDAGSFGLGDYPELDTATSKVAALAAMSDAAFNAAVGDVGTAINNADKEAYGSTKAQAAQLAQQVQAGTQWAWNRNNDLTAALASGDTATVTQARLDIQNALSTALGNARLALNALFGPSPPTPGAPPPAPAPSGGGGFAPVVTRPPSQFPANVVSAGQAAVNALSADPSYCTSVSQPGSPVNAAVHTFKTAWNSSQSPKVPVGTGNYEPATALALGQVTGSAPPACSVKPSPAPSPVVPPRQFIATQPSSGMSTATIAGLALVGAAGVGAAVYMTTRKSKPTRRRRRR